MEATNFVFWHWTNDGMPQVIDGVVLDEAGVRIGRYSGETLEELSTHYSDVKVATVDEFISMHESALRTDPREISESDYIDALEIMPPLDWRQVRGVESFKWSEFYSGNMTNAYAKHGGRYGSFMDSAYLSADAIADKILALSVENFSMGA